MRLKVADEEAQRNPALDYCLRERHKIRLPELPEEPDAQSLARLLRDVRARVREQEWEVTEEIWFSTFSFESLVIYRDLQTLSDSASEHPVVATLAKATVGASEALFDDLDSAPVPSAVPIPVMSTDSSQLEALSVAAAGRHVVVHGPPGTGKSQIIANLIADALSKNQKVLFVSAKMATLNVVHERLKELGLQRFCLEAHSTKAGKQKIIDELRRTLEHDGARDSSALDRELQALLQVREQLTAYARDLHKRIEPLGTTIHSQVCDRIGEAAKGIESLMPGAVDLSLREWRALSEPLKTLSDVRELPLGWHKRSPEELETTATLFRDASNKTTEVVRLRTELRELTVKPPSDLVPIFAGVRHGFGSWHAPLRPSYWRWRSRGPRDTDVQGYASADGNAGRFWKWRFVRLSSTSGSSQTRPL